jgi:hypothetical protein
MGSSISKIYDDYDDYKYICQLLNEKPLDISKFMKHEDEILTKNGYKDKYDLFEKSHKQKQRENKLNNLGIN